MFSTVIGGCEFSRHFNCTSRISTANTWRFPMSYRTSGQKELRRIRGQRASSIAGLLCENAANFQQLMEIIRVGSFFFQQKKVSGTFPGQSEGHLVAFATWDGGRKAGKHLNVSRTGI